MIWIVITLLELPTVAIQFELVVVHTVALVSVKIEAADGASELPMLIALAKCALKHAVAWRGAYHRHELAPPHLLFSWLPRHHLCDI